MVERANDDLVGEDVELLLLFAMHVLVVRGAEDVYEARLVHLPRYQLRSQSDVAQDVGEGAGGLRMQALLVDKKARYRNDVALEHSPNFPRLR